MSSVARRYKQNNADPGWCYEQFLQSRSLKQVIDDHRGAGGEEKTPLIVADRLDRARSQADSVRQQLTSVMSRNDVPLVSTPFESTEYYVNIRKVGSFRFFAGRARV